MANKNGGEEQFLLLGGHRNLEVDPEAGERGMQAAGAGGAKAEACSRLREEKAQAAQAEYRRQNERRRGYMLLLMIVPILLMVLVWHLVSSLPGQTRRVGDDDLPLLPAGGRNSQLDGKQERPPAPPPAGSPLYSTQSPEP
mmetsp:Transcript_40544/g.129206  ORF Transcript_40544/g.129206 Transcript_40544/m.129206 type:complete len:141 (+) Transcript_40544:105-527(+)